MDDQAICDLVEDLQAAHDGSRSPRLQLERKGDFLGFFPKNARLVAAYHKLSPKVLEAK